MMSLPVIWHTRPSQIEQSYKGGHGDQASLSPVQWALARSHLWSSMTCDCPNTKLVTILSVLLYRLPMTDLRMDIIENQDFFMSKLWEDRQLYMVSPKSREVWPRKISASNLKFVKYFIKFELPERDLAAFNGFISSIPIPVLEERVMHRTWLETCTDMLCSQTYLLEEGKCFIARVLYYWCLTCVLSYMWVDLGKQAKWRKMLNWYTGQNVFHVT